MKILETILAMEADDITAEAEKSAKNIVGTGTSSGDNADDGNGDIKEDLNNTEDIFGIKENKRKMEEAKSATDKNLDKKGEESNNKDADMPNKDEKGEDDDANNAIDPNLDDNLDSDSDISNLSFYDKNRLKNNMVLLHDIITANIKVITHMMNNVADILSISVCNMCIGHLNNCKNLILDILENEIETKSYEELVKDYITIKRIHDICAEILYKHFDNIKKSADKKAKKKA